MKCVPGYENRYAATQCGQIYSSYLNGYLKPKVDKDGYLMVCLQKNGIKKYFQVHRLIAITYLDNAEDLPTVNHKDGIKNNNKVSNLEWMSHSDNIKHAHSIGLACNRGRNNNRSKLSEDDVRSIRVLLDTKQPKKIAKMYGVVPGTIYNIVSKRSWKHIV